MDWNKGLKRISTVFWGFWALFVAGLLVGSIFGQVSSEGWGYMFLTFPALFALHWVTCWIVDGFFAKK